MNSALKTLHPTGFDYRPYVLKMFSAAERARFHHVQFRQAAKILAGIRAAQGEMDPAIVKECDDYARHVLGWKGYAPWLYVYAAVAGTFKEGWIPDNFYGAVVVPALSAQYGDVSDLKPLSRSLFASELFPDLASSVNGLFFNRELCVVNERELKGLLFAEREKIVFKIDASQQGRGVYVFDESSFDVNKIRSLRNGVFQEYIDQHPALEELVPSSVTAVRITTVIDDDGTCSARASFLKTSRSGETHTKTGSQVLVALDPESGAFAENGYLQDWLPIDRHPDSQAVFAGKRVPEYDKCAATVLELHRKVPFVRCIGWDLSVTKSNDVKIMEWNGGHNGISFSEATQGPCFADLHWEKLRLS